MRIDQGPSVKEMPHDLLEENFMSPKSYSWEYLEVHIEILSAPKQMQFYFLFRKGMKLC